MRVFGKFLFQGNRVYIWSAASVSLILLSLFKFMYPYPNMVYDSYFYTIAAMSHALAGPWAIGYSWFLQLFGVFSHSPLLLTVFQYLFLEASLWVFFLTLTNFFSFAKVSKWCLFGFLFINPIFLFCANFVMADSLFISLSILWISLLIWIVFRTYPVLIYLHAILILLAFVVRYNALYYPLVATFAFIISRYNWWQKLLGICLQVVLVAGFVWFTSLQVRDITGVAQFSPFGNWKTANDALYMYGHIYRDDHDSVPTKFSVLHHTVQQYFKAENGKTDDLLDYTSHFYGSVYMFYYTSPLIKYKDRLYGVDTEEVNFKKMAYMGPLYGSYGAWLISKHPIAFAQYFVGPNAVRYLFPPMEAFASYTPFMLRPDYLGQAARSWFRVKTLSAGWSVIRLRNYLLAPWPIVAAIIHLMFVFSLVSFFALKEYRWVNKDQLGALAMLVVLWICDLGFNLTAAATVMRYEIFLLVIEFSLVLWLTERTYFKKVTLNKMIN
jgi:hypothetical protein